MGQTCEACCQTDYRDPDLPLYNIRSQTDETPPNSSTDEDIYSSDMDNSVNSYASKMDNLQLTEQEIKSLKGAYIVTLDGWKKAIEAGNELLAERMIDEHPEIDFFKHYWDDGSSALQIACKHQKTPLIFFLLTQDANVNEQNPETLDTALHIAVRVRDKKIVDLLLKWDADPNIENKKNETAISISAAFSDQSMYRLLIGNDDEFDVNPPKMARFVTNAQRITAIHDDLEAIVKADSLIIDHGHHINNDDSKKRSLPKLEGWLEKMKPKKGIGGMKSYQRRWIIVRGAYILWSDKVIFIDNDASREERKKFKGSIHFMTVESISPLITTQNNKLIVKAHDAKTGNMRDYVFRTVNQIQRDFWIDGLKKHKQQYQSVMRYLGKTS